MDKDSSDGVETSSLHFAYTRPNSIFYMNTNQPGRIASWINKHLNGTSANDASQESVFRKIRENLASNHAEQPVVSIVIVARNEEFNLLACLSSLSEQVIHYPYEIIVCNNNSEDKTQDIIDRCGVNSIFQPAEGAAYAREAGMWIARGKYHLCAQANCVYPPDWAARMIEPLEKGEAICTVGSIGMVQAGAEMSFWSTLVTEFVAKVKSLSDLFRRADQVANGASMAFFTRMGQQVGWRKDVVTGEERHMVQSMSRYGKIKYVNLATAKPLKIKNTGASRVGGASQDGNWSHPVEFREFMLN
jgi:glycosyltransferase involved in cell wall biosynthesis